MIFVQVAVSINIQSTLTYSSEEPLEIGNLVLVEVGNKRVKGVVLDILKEFKGDFEVKPIIEILPYTLKKHHIQLLRWMHSYYLSGWDSILRLFLPPGEIRRETLKVRLKKFEGDIPHNDLVEFLVSRGKKWTAISTLRKKFGSGYRKELSRLAEMGFIQIKEVKRRVKEKEVIPEEIEDLYIPSTPTHEQKAALDQITPYVDRGGFNTFLIHGVTGSGKTALYLWLASRAIKDGKSVYILVPEIALSHQISRYFQKAFGSATGVYHSNLTPGERRWLWNRAYYGDLKLIVGPRSCLFLPLKNPGLIVVDEEHDTSYKEDRAPFYNARDAAVILGKILDIPVVLGSATPSLESYYNSITGKYKLIKLKKRVHGYYMPRVEIVDMREEKSDSVLSIKMLEELKKTVFSRKQAILFLNRRGFSHHLQCADCGHIEKCPHCSVSLVYHKSSSSLRCHVCGYSKKAPDMCPSCGSYRLKPVGVGTERVQEELEKFFPGNLIVRMDLDTTRKKGAHAKIYRDFLHGRKKIMIGTQMVTKGFDFPGVSFVGILLADSILAIPDFRAEEFTFQLINQVSGRSRKGGKVIVQTYSPEDLAIRSGTLGDYERFFWKELENRKAFGYPPFVRIAILEVRSKSLKSASTQAFKFYKLLEEINDGTVELIGPAPAPIEKVMGYHRIRILLKSRKAYAIQNLLRKTDIPSRSGKSVVINVDPVTFM